MRRSINSKNASLNCPGQLFSRLKYLRSVAAPLTVMSSSYLYQTRNEEAHSRSWIRMFWVGSGNHLWALALARWKEGFVSSFDVWLSVLFATFSHWLPHR